MYAIISSILNIYSPFFGYILKARVETWKTKKKIICTASKEKPFEKRHKKQK